MSQDRLHVVLAHKANILESDASGGAVRFALDLLDYLRQQSVFVTFLGTGKNLIKNSDYLFVPVSDEKDWWWPYKFIVRMFSKTRSNVPQSAIIQTFRLDTMLPFMVLTPRNPKAIMSDEPLSALRLKVKRPILKILEFLYRTVERQVMRKIDLLITDPNTASSYVRRFPWMRNKLAIMPTSTVNTEIFRPMNRELLRKKYGFNPEDKIILFVGRIAKVKGIDLLLKSYKMLSSKSDKTSLVIVGEGEYMPQLRENIRKMGLSKVTLIGNIPHSAVPEIMNCADVFVLPSLSEGSPTVVREALACGIPVVSTKVGDVHTIINDSSIGKLVSHDEYELCNAINSFLNGNGPGEVEKRLQAVKGFTRETVMKRMLELYIKLSRTIDRNGDKN